MQRALGSNKMMSIPLIPGKAHQTMGVSYALNSYSLSYIVGLLPLQGWRSSDTLLGKTQGTLDQDRTEHQSSQATAMYKKMRI